MAALRPEVAEYLDKVHAIAEAMGGAAAVKAVESGSIQPPNRKFTDTDSTNETYFYSLAPDGSVIKKKLF